MNALQARWAQLAPRERRLLGLALAVILAALLWQLLLAPALRTLRTAGTQAQAQALDAQLQQMQTLQAQAKALQQQAPLSYDDALRALNQATKQTLGASAQISVSAERATVTLQAASADALAQWLTQSRLNARATPLEARLNRIATPSGVTWSGVLVMGLPQR
ncbi:MAG: type II secretion system protein M [Burkholderiales bacterium]|nr:type II secretion system protein M [Burkholderiales bacterium]